MKIYNYAVLLRNYEYVDDVLTIDSEIEHEPKHQDDAICDATQRLRSEEDEGAENFAGGTVVVKFSGFVQKEECESNCILEEDEREFVKVNHKKFIRLDDEVHQLFEDFTTDRKSYNCDCYEADAVAKEDSEGNSYRCWYVKGYGWCAIRIENENE